MDKLTYQDGACIKTSCNHVHAWSLDARCTSCTVSVSRQFDSP